MLEVDDNHDWWPMLSDPEFIKYPFKVLQSLLLRSPVHYDNSSDIYFILGHSEFQKILSSPMMTRDTRLWKGGWNTPEYRTANPLSYELFSGNQAQMINSDGSDHQRMRQVYNPCFRAQIMKNLANLIQEECDKILDSLPENQSFDFVKQVAARLPLRVMNNLFDIPESLDAQIGSWSASIIRLNDIILSEKQKLDALSAQNNFKAYLREEIQYRRSKDTSSFMAQAIRAFDEGVLNEDETVTNLMSMILAGHETTVSLLGSGLYLLLKNPKQMNKLKDQPTRMHRAIEEMLRVEPSGTMILRIAREEYRLDEYVIPKGSMVIGMIAATNYDPRRFCNPFDFDIERSPNPQLTFGGGVHFCIGAALARLEASILLSSLFDRFSSIELVEEPSWRHDRLNARGLAELNLRIEKK